MAFINFNKVRISLNRYLVIEDVSLSVEKGEIVSLFGPSGSGKTTLFKALLGLISLQHGFITLNNQPIENYKLPISYVPQFNDLLPWLTVEKNIQLSYQESKKNSKALNVLNPLDAIEIVGLSNAKSKLPKELSGGMAKRTALARCLAMNAEIMLLDEAFVSVEKTLKDELLVKIRQFVKSNNITCLIISHDLEELTYLSDRVIHLSSSPATILKEATNTLPYDRYNVDFNSTIFADATGSLIIPKN